MCAARTSSFLLAAFAALCLPASAQAQTFATYHCADGTDLPVVFYSDTRAVSLQLDGKAIHLPQRVSLTGARYAKGGITLRFTREQIMLGRKGGAQTVCTPG